MCSIEKVIYKIGYDIFKRCNFGAASLEMGLKIIFVVKGGTQLANTGYVSSTRSKAGLRCDSRWTCVKSYRILFIVMGTLPASFKGLVKSVNSIEVSEVLKAK